MPFAEQLISVSCIRTLGQCLSQGSPGLAWTAVNTVTAALPGLGLAARAAATRDALLADMPGGYRECEEIVSRALEDPAFTGWMIWPVSEAVAARALASAEGDAFESGLALLARLTTRLTGEFAIRAFLNADLDRTLRVVQTWVAADDDRLRRLASEGTRPRLPWAKRVPALFARPEVTLSILDALHRDSSEFVRRSVGNHLNDISRIAPGLAVDVARRWVTANGEVPPVVRHGMRTLIKQAHPAALALMGFGSAQDLRVDGPLLHTPRVAVGQAIEFDYSVTNTGAGPVKVAIDYVIHFRKASGALAPRVYKLAVRTLAPGETVVASRRHPLVPLTTRRHYPGAHALELQVNGMRHGQAAFDLAAVIPLGSRLGSVETAATFASEDASAAT
ncbi:MAG TPA: DNA alkylation repair protein [Trebonia sp.]|jgi:3-methyladenine DNA glycosylase AlkC|nr:DNA alkylation repair protein [Trebonia sp.]